MSFSRVALAAFVLSVAAGFAPVAASATTMATPHMCRDAKGHFIKGKYLKCPKGTHHV
jgi:hypothetical protein